MTKKNFIFLLPFILLSFSEASPKKQQQCEEGIVITTAEGIVAGDFQETDFTNFYQADLSWDSIQKVSQYSIDYKMALSLKKAIRECEEKILNNENCSCEEKIESWKKELLSKEMELRKIEERYTASNYIIEQEIEFMGIKRLIRYYLNDKYIEISRSSLNPSKVK